MTSEAPAPGTIMEINLEQVEVREIHPAEIHKCMGFRMELEQFMRAVDVVPEVEQFLGTVDVVPEASGKNNIVIGVPLVSSGSVSDHGPGRVARCQPIIPIATAKSSMTTDQITARIGAKFHWSAMCAFTM